MSDTVQTAVTSFNRVAVFSPRLRQLLETGCLVQAKDVRLRPNAKDAPKIEAVLSLRSDRTKDEAIDYAKRHGRPFLSLELGMYCSAWGGKKARPWSLIIDDSTLATNAQQPCPIERLLGANASDEGCFTPELLTRAARLRQFIVEHRLSRFADAFSVPRELEQAKSRYRPVIVVVPTIEECGSANGEHPSHQLRTLVERALSEHPLSPIWVLSEVNPLSGEVARAPKTLLAHPRICELPCNVDRGWLLERAAQIYTVASPLGFEALLRDVPVTVLGRPFYTGWGLTEDLESGLVRSQRRSLNELVAAALLIAPRYYDPVRSCPTTAEAALEFLALQRQRYLENQGHFLCVGFSFWKRAILRRYLESKGNRIEFLRDAETLTKTLAKTQAATDTRVVVWASRPHDDVGRIAEARALPLWRLEDGFLRSVGLGSDWAAPGSLVFDTRGIYYDPRQPSLLEHILQTAEYSKAELEQAETLRQEIVTLRVSKYNSHQDRDFSPRCSPGQKVVLVPGQVADDASVRFGGSQVGGVKELLAAVRRLEPSAHIVYKPHPDVLSGNRRGLIDEGQGILFDELVLDVPIARCLERVDAVHTISSLVGFEALLRKTPVVCHGQPFYSGWGLTHDLDPLERRQRKLTLPMLVASVLIRYPRYYHFPTGTFCNAAQMASVIALSRKMQAEGNRQPQALRRLKSLLRLARDINHAG